MVWFTLYTSDILEPICLRHIVKFVGNDLKNMKYIGEDYCILRTYMSARVKPIHIMDCIRRRDWISNRKNFMKKIFTTYLLKNKLNRLINNINSYIAKSGDRLELKQNKSYHGILNMCGIVDGITVHNAIIKSRIPIFHMLNVDVEFIKHYMENSSTEPRRRTTVPGLSFWNSFYVADFLYPLSYYPIRYFKAVLKCIDPTYSNEPIKCVDFGVSAKQIDRSSHVSYMRVPYNWYNRTIEKYSKHTIKKYSKRHH